MRWTSRDLFDRQKGGPRVTFFEKQVDLPLPFQEHREHTQLCNVLNPLRKINRLKSGTDSPKVLIQRSTLKQKTTACGEVLTVLKTVYSKFHQISRGLLTWTIKHETTSLV